MDEEINEAFPSLRDEPIRIFAEELRKTIESAVVVETTGWAHELVRAAAENLAKVVSRPFEAVLIWTSHPNAFTAPGRYVYISRELLSRGLGEPGVAFVLAHEIAHHELNHLDAFDAILRDGLRPAALRELAAA